MKRVLQEGGKNPQTETRKKGRIKLPRNWEKDGKTLEGEARRRRWPENQGEERETCHKYGVARKVYARGGKRRERGKGRRTMPNEKIERATLLKVKRRSQWKALEKSGREMEGTNKRGGGGREGQGIST